MPNHITTQVEITGTKEQIDDLIKKTKIKLDCDSEDNEFDFNGIAQMPEELLNTVSPTDIVATQEEADKINADYAEHTKDATYKGAPTRAISEAEKERRTKEYGALNWHDFASNNWGTKWNAYEVRFTEHTDTKLVVQFDTAWDTPRIIWNKLEDMGYTVKGVYYGEMDGFEYIGEDAGDVWEAYTNVEVEYVG